jgi:hypothetical protein
MRYMLIRVQSASRSYSGYPVLESEVGTKSVYNSLVANLILKRACMLLLHTVL